MASTIRSIRGRGKLSLGHARLTLVKSMQSHHLLLWATEPLLEVMPITVWSPPEHSAEPPPSRAEELGRKRPEADGDGDSLILNAELAAGVVSSILRDSDLKRSGALSLSLKGVTSVSSCVLLCLLLSWA